MLMEAQSQLVILSGMTGSRCVGHLTRELVRSDKQFGVVTMCVGGGMGASGLFERYPS